MKKTKRISWETVAALAIFVLGLVGVLALTPPATIEALGALDWTTIAAAVVTVCGAVGAALGRRLLRDETDS